MTNLQKATIIMDYLNSFVEEDDEFLLIDCEDDSYIISSIFMNVTIGMDQDDGYAINLNPYVSIDAKIWYANKLEIAL